jgi:hypothetical protein
MRRTALVTSTALTTYAPVNRVDPPQRGGYLAAPHALVVKLVDTLS